MYLSTTYNLITDISLRPLPRNEILRYDPGKVHPTTGHEAPEAEQKYRSTL
jgi:hypothetical protein